jgi:hypothetical protein
MSTMVGLVGRAANDSFRPVSGGYTMGRDTTVDPADLPMSYAL